MTYYTYIPLRWGPDGPWAVWELNEDEVVFMWKGFRTKEEAEGFCTFMQNKA